MTRPSSYRESAKPPSEKEIESLSDKFAALLRSEKEQREEIRQLRERETFYLKENDRLQKVIKKYEQSAQALDAGGAIQVQLHQLRNAFQGAKENIAALEHARDVAIGLVRAALAGADPGEVAQLAESIRATGRAGGISLRALPAPKEE